MGEFIVIVLIIFGFLYFIGLIFYGIDKAANAVSNKVSKNSSSNERTQITPEKKKAVEFLLLAEKIATKEGLLNNFNKNKTKLYSSLLNYVTDNEEIDLDAIAAIICFALGNLSDFIMTTGYDFNIATIAIFRILFDMQIYTNDICVKDACNTAIDLFLYGDMIDYLKKMNDENQN